MKKIKLHKKLYEADNTQQLNNQLDEKIIYTNPDLELTNAVKQDMDNEYKKNIIRGGILFNVKLTKDFFNNLEFPKANSSLNALLQVANMPRKYTDVHDSIDADPTKTIANAEDLATKFFSGGKTTFDDKQKDKNESLYYSEYNELYEDLGLAATAGLGAGTWLTNVIAHGAAFAGGITAGASPVIAGAYGLGGLSVKMSADHGNFHTDDSDILKTKDMPTYGVSKGSSQTDLPKRIDSYISAIMDYIQQPLVQSTPKSASLDIQDLYSYVANLHTRTIDDVEEFLKTNDKYFKDIKELQTRDKLYKLQDEKTIALKQADFYEALSMSTNSNEERKRIIDEIKAKTKKAPDYEIANIYQQAITKLKNNNHLEVSSTPGHGRRTHENIEYHYKGTLNESDFDDYDEDDEQSNINDLRKEKPLFDADKLYDDIYGQIHTKMVKIFSHTEDVPADVEKARKQMEQLRDEASKTIKERIEIVCRLTNDNQIGLSGKVASFISKHPMRARYLTELWSRHEQDLNSRIERRLDHMVSLLGNAPLLMARQFYTTTIPNLIAMMMVYKVIITLFSREEGIDINFYKDITDDDVKDKTGDLSEYPQVVAGVFFTEGNALNAENKNVYVK